MDMTVEDVLRRWMALAALCVAAPQAFGQLPPIYEGVASTPVPVATVAALPRKTFLENIARGAGGDLFITSYLEGKVYRISAKGRRTTWALVEGTIAGIALNPDGSALLSGWLRGEEPSVFMIDAHGATASTIALPEGQFPNGVVRLGVSRYLVADSYKGTIWLVDTASRSVLPWLQDTLLERASAENPTPGVNGMKLHRGALVVSNTAKQLLVRIPIVDGRASTPEVMATNIGIDDFDFDRAGNLIGATHVYQSLVRRSPAGDLSLLAGLDQGMAGSTAVVVVGNSAWVTTNGGMSLPPPGGLQPARVLRVSLPRP